MVNRILELIRLKEMSSSQFAEEIGVQRSSISHLISGRNKPSLEFLQKIINRFPEVNMEYLLTGQGNLLREGQEPYKGILSVLELPEKEEEEKIEPEIPPQEIKRKARKPVLEKNTPDVQDSLANNRSIEKIVFFYKDKSFTEYYPE
jgi:transcriptional regulator with XRE-family HTH domain